MSDPINSPKHYTHGNVEALDAIRAAMSFEGYEGFLVGQVLKYLWRYRYKGRPVEDLNKGAFYYERLIKHLTVLDEEV